MIEMLLFKLIKLSESSTENTYFMHRIKFLSSRFSSMKLFWCVCDLDHVVYISLIESFHAKTGLMS